jgi:hypothetical protein
MIGTNASKTSNLISLSIVKVKKKKKQFITYIKFVEPKPRTNNKI